jgi:hypothetical protein
MTFGADIGSLYRQHGPNHILPFIGGSYEARDPKAFRVAVVGINAYATNAELRKGNIEDGVGNAKAWENAGLEKPHDRHPLGERRGAPADGARGRVDPPPR